MKKTIRTNEEINKFSLYPKKEWVYEDEIQERVSENYSPYSYVEEADAKCYDQKQLIEFDWTKES